MLSIDKFVQWQTTSLEALFHGTTHAWEALDNIDAWLKRQLNSPGVRILGTVQPGAFVDKDVIVGRGSVIEAGACVKGPAYIGSHTEVRHGAYLRAGSVVGNGCVIGHASEIKASILLDGSAASHFNYVGDSILGKHSNLGAGVKLSNVKHTKTEIVLSCGDEKFHTGRIKLGAVIGDYVNLGCGVITNPGTLIGPGTLVYPNAVLRGVYPGESIIKVTLQLEVVQKRN
ncbi:MAG: hypothetical protein GX316_04425 [Firmicutes bacterium]|nr:hypothetical protein [Bacillota bacterium]